MGYVAWKMIESTRGRSHCFRTRFENSWLAQNLYSGGCAAAFHKASSTFLYFLCIQNPNVAISSVANAVVRKTKGPFVSRFCANFEYKATTPAEPTQHVEKAAAVPPATFHIRGDCDGTSDNFDRILNPLSGSFKCSFIPKMFCN